MQPTTTILATATRALLGSSSCRYQLQKTHSQKLLIFATSAAAARQFSTRQLSPSIAFLSNSEHDAFMQKSKKKVAAQQVQAQKITSKKPLSLAEYSNDESRPLSVLLCWLMSKPRAVQKYAQFYLDQGFDVLTVRISPWQLLWPASYNPIVQQELLPVLQSAPHEKKLIHGFSVGGYVFSQLLKHFRSQPTEYETLARSIQAQIWDSVVDVNGVAVGVSKSVFLNSVVGQRALQKYIETHMRVFYNVATKYYEEAHEHFYHAPLHAPALFLASKIDPISTIDVIQAVQQTWKSAGISCESQVWDNTTHVGHMVRYPDEYKKAIRTFLGKVEWKSDGGARRTEKATVTTPRTTVEEPSRRPIGVPVPSFA